MMFLTTRQTPPEALKSIQLSGFFLWGYYIEKLFGSCRGGGCGDVRFFRLTFGT